MFNNGNNGGGNPNHDENGRFTSGANKASGNNNYEEKVKKAIGINASNKASLNDDTRKMYPSQRWHDVEEGGEEWIGNKTIDAFDKLNIKIPDSLNGNGGSDLAVIARLSNKTGQPIENLIQQYMESSKYARKQLLNHWHDQAYEEKPQLKFGNNSVNAGEDNPEYEEKLKETMGIEPEWKKLGYDEDVDEAPSKVSKVINKDGENLTGNINLSKQDVVDFLEDQLSAPLPEKDKQLILEKGMVPKRILNQLNIENLEDALDEYYEGVDDDEWELKY